MRNAKAPIGSLAVSLAVVGLVTYFYIGLNLKVRDVASLGIAYVAFTAALIAYLWVSPKNELLNFWAKTFSYSPYVVLIGMWLWFSYSDAHSAGLI
jgi:hypothetical protein